MAAVNFRSATSITGNNTLQGMTLPTVVAGDVIVLVVGFIQSTGTVTLSISGSGTWTHQGTDSVLGTALQVATYTAVSVDGSESGATVNANLSTLEKLAMAAASYSGVYQLNPLGLSTPQYVQYTTSDTNSATSASVSPTGTGSMVVEYFLSKSTTNTSYTTPSGTTLRTSAFGSGGGAADILLVDSNGPVTSGGGHTSTMGTATGSKIAGTLVLNNQLVKGVAAAQAVKRAAFF